MKHVMMESILRTFNNNFTQSLSQRLRIVLILMETRISGYFKECGIKFVNLLIYDEILDTRNVQS